VDHLIHLPRWGICFRRIMCVRASACVFVFICAKYLKMF